MNKNKYIMFVAIGFELIGLIVFAIYFGEWIVEKGAPEWSKAASIVVAFILWFVSLMIKLRSADKSSASAGSRLNSEND